MLAEPQPVLEQAITTAENRPVARRRLLKRLTEVEDLEAKRRLAADEVF